MAKQTILFALFALLLAACDSGENGADAYGNFEATEVLVGAEVSGKILQFELEEGDRVQAGRRVGLIDTVPLHLQKQQLEARIRAISRKTQDVEPRIEVLRERRSNLLREKRRVAALLRDSAATPKQLDDLEGEIEVVDQEIEATRSQYATANRSVLAEIEPLEAQIRQVEDQLSRCFILNPLEGVVLLKLVEPHEMVSAGVPLYKIADLSEMILRVYVSGAQLPEIEIGQEVSVRIDDGREGYRHLKGKISWIAEEAEFTPQMIQTKEERVDLVYAVKVRVPNEGALKIGMPGEVFFTAPDESLVNGGSE